MAEPNPGLFNRLNTGAGSYTGGFAITPSDSTVFAQPTRAINCGSGGTCTVVFVDGSSCQLTLATGQTIPIAVVKVMSAGTGASALSGLY